MGFGLFRFWHGVDFPFPGDGAGTIRLSTEITTRTDRVQPISVSGTSSGH